MGDFLTDGMLMDWLHWLQEIRPEELALVLILLLVVDAPRYAWSAVAMACWDIMRTICGTVLRRRRRPPRFSVYRPTVSVLIAGYNEADTIARTMASVRGNYPGLQTVVVDDGSTDDMYGAALAFATGKTDITVIRRQHRGGKSSALNLGLFYVTGEIVVCVDADSQVSTGAIEELVQPLKDPAVAGVSGTVVAWNPFVNLATWLQAYEYRQTIFVGRMARGRIGLLGIVSGAFGAFRTEYLRQTGGWDVGPGEDGDLVLRLRKAGYRISAAPCATCRTNVPVTWPRLFRQRCRWDRTVITFECRKHADLGSLFNRNFRWSSFLIVLERWIFGVVCLYTFWLYGLSGAILGSARPFCLLALLYACSLILELVQLLVLLMYSDRIRNDLALSVVIPLYPLYQIFIKAVDLVALSGEILVRDSGRDDFVPERVRAATWIF